MNCDEDVVLPLLTTDEAIELVAGAWMRHGSCTWVSDVDIEESADEEMKLVCSGCIVRGHCLAYGLLIDAKHFIYGGLDPGERRAFDNGQRHAICSAPNCGRAFIWNRSGSAQAPGVCETCNSTEHLSTSYTYGGTP